MDLHRRTDVLIRVLQRQTGKTRAESSGGDAKSKDTQVKVVGDGLMDDFLSTATQTANNARFFFFFFLFFSV